jgi:hypothetical protein
VQAKFAPAHPRKSDRSGGDQHVAATLTGGVLQTERGEELELIHPQTLRQVVHDRVSILARLRKRSSPADARSGGQRILASSAVSTLVGQGSNLPPRLGCSTNRI